LLGFYFSNLCAITIKAHGKIINVDKKFGNKNPGALTFKKCKRSGIEFDQKV